MPPTTVSSKEVSSPTAGRMSQILRIAPAMPWMNFGPISGYELLEEKTVGSTLLRRTCISFNSDLPLRWRFYFYKAQGTWKLVDLRIDDGLVELFEESIRPRK